MQKTFTFDVQNTKKRTNFFFTSKSFCFCFQYTNIKDKIKTPKKHFLRKEHKVFMIFCKRIGVGLSSQIASSALDPVNSAMINPI